MYAVGQDKKFFADAIEPASLMHPCQLHARMPCRRQIHTVIYYGQHITEATVRRFVNE